MPLPRRRTPVIILAVVLFLRCASVDAPRPRTFASDRIQVTSHGDGPDVVLIAGLDSLASEVWAGVLHDVPGYRYHVVQVAGFGGFPANGNAGDGPVVE